jgi:hypothetical protein
MNKLGERNTRKPTPPRTVPGDKSERTLAKKQSQPPKPEIYGGVKRKLPAQPRSMGKELGLAFTILPHCFVSKRFPDEKGPW